MQRNTAVAVGLLFALVLVLVLVLGQGSKRSRVASPQASASAKIVGPSAPSASVLASALAQTPQPASSADEAGSSEAFDLLPDGRKAPEVPASAPKQVGFGVAVFAYQGAQSATKDPRTKEEARSKAEGLIAEAKHDFAAVVAKGDPGSTANAGHVPRDVLEPAIEYVLFTLQKGEVYSAPVDTPRGYWIVRRND